ncbi:serine hydrolase [Hyphococcus sp.]|uniref:serine hydrolase n=1 Tax=Hyphococcus sp. TaxID=2038636 RepID=UPI0035C6F499
MMSLRAKVSGVIAILAASMLSVAISAPASAQTNPLGYGSAQEEDSAADKPESQRAIEAATAEDEDLPALTKADVDAWLDGLMPYALREADIVGAVVTVVKDSEILTSRGFGYSNLESKTPVEGDDTIFRPGSISKLFTWIAVMQLVERGEIDLDKDINTYLDFEITDAFGKPITMRHLMTHTPGFQEQFKNLLMADPALYLPLEDILKSTPPPARIFPPGETPAYSNYGTSLAGYIVQRLSGESFEEYVERHILEPLGMTLSTFRQPLPAQFEPYMSKGYNSASEGEAQHYELVSGVPAGALAASGEDMGRFMIALLDRDPALMKPETWRQFYETIYQLTPPLNAMALGIWQLNKGDLRIYGHGGDTNFFHSDLNVLPDRNVGIYVSVNSTGHEGAGGTLRFAVTTSFEERYFPETITPVGPRLATAKDHGALVAGIYESSRTVATNFAAILRILGQQKISMNEDNDLVFSLFGAPTVWREVEPYVWRHVDGYERLAAVVNEKEELEYVTFEPISPIIHLTPAPWHRSSALWLPLVAGAIGVLLLTLVFWPVRAAVRWRYKAAFPHRGSEATAFRLVRIGAVLVFVFIAAWVYILLTLLADVAGLGDAFVAQLRIAQFTQIFLYAAMAITLWNAFIVWQSRQSVFAKVWSSLLSIAVLIIVLFAAFNGLLSLDANF